MTAQDERKKVLDELKQEIKYLNNLYGLCVFWSRPISKQIEIQNLINPPQAKPIPVYTDEIYNSYWGKLH